MAKTRIGLDVGSTAARAVEVNVSSNPPVLVRAAQVPMQPGAVENGEVRQPDAVSEALRDLWRRGGFKGRQVYMGVGNQRVVVREVALPWLPEKELRDSLPYQVQEFIPIPVDEAVLDFDPLEEFEQEGRRMTRVLLVAAQRGMIEALVKTATAAKLDPVGLDLIPFALIRSIGGGGDGSVLAEENEEALIDVGHDVTSICVHARTVPRFVRILPSGGNDITVAVARALGMPEEEADRMKRGETVEGGPNPADAQRVAQGRVVSFVDEIRSSLEFYNAQSPGSHIGRLRVTGGGSKLAGFLDMLSQRLGVPAEPGGVFAHVHPELDLSQEALVEAEPLLAVAIGLALPGGR
ncbi:MAG: type IV pilus assembly protein PilM [Actinomycetota bacterium]